jgi:hypothetical protein
VPVHVSRWELNNFVYKKDPKKNRRPNNPNSSRFESPLSNKFHKNKSQASQLKNFRHLSKILGEADNSAEQQQQQ